MHRVDAQLTATGAHEPIPTDLAADGIAEYVEAFVATALATGAAPEADATLHLELTDTDAVVSADLPRPGPATLLRGSPCGTVATRWAIWPTATGTGSPTGRGSEPDPSTART